MITLPVLWSAVASAARHRCGWARSARENIVRSPQTAVAAKKAAPSLPPWLRTGNEWLWGLLLVAAVVLAYQPVWHAGFIWDDDFYVTQNPLLTAPDGLKRIWFSLDSPSQYFPLTYTTFRVEHALWGLNPVGYHWVNLLLHAANGLLVWRLLKRLAVPGAWLAAALFALHPVQVESVAWITERKNVLSLFFYLLAVRAWVEFVGDRPQPPWRWYGLALLAGALALCAKTTACTLPAALLLVMWLRHKPLSLSRLAGVIPFAVLGLAMGLLSVWWERYHQGTRGDLFAFGPVDRLLIASHALWFYAGKLLWPVGLTFSYPRWTINPADPLAYGWLVAGAALCAAVWFARRRVGRSVEVAGLFYVAALSPLLGFIMNYTFRYSFVADHYQYAACIGPLALVAAALTRGGNRWTGPAALPRVAVCAILLAALGVLTWRQCRIYASEETLWRATLAQNPSSWLAQDNLATVLDLEGRLDEALIHYRASVDIYPGHSEARSNLGAALDRQGRLDEAITQFHLALQLDPGNAEARNNLGNALLQKGSFEDAITQFQAAVRLKPGYAQARLGLGNALRQNGRLDEAMAQYSEARRIKPDYAEACNNLGSALDQKGRLDDAILQYQAALQINPAYAEARLNLGSDLLKQGRVDDAIVQYQAALNLRPDYLEARSNLGNALLKKGRLDDALVQFQMILKDHPDSAGAHFGLGNVLRQQGRLAGAIAHFRTALQLRPADPAVENNLAWVLATGSQPSLRDGDQAVALARQASARTGGANPVILRTLAAALAETGRFSEAVETAQLALRLAEAQANAWLTGTLQAELKLYQARQPFHEPPPKP
jgi:tetratricopeptide (TPR) repeat protein